jgi:hypothetical protein
VTDEFLALMGRLEAAGYDIQHEAMNRSTRRFPSHDIFGNRLELTDGRSASTDN